MAQRDRDRVKVTQNTEAITKAERDSDNDSDRVRQTTEVSETAKKGRERDTHTETKRL